MSRFGEAFLKGQEAARKAEEMRKEIEDVFKKLNEELLAITDGKLMLEIIAHPFKSEPYKRIVAKNPKIGNDAYIAQWHQSYNGYPCTIKTEQSESACHDRESLENELALLLENDRISEKLKSIINTAF